MRDIFLAGPPANSICILALHTILKVCDPRPGAMDGYSPLQFLLLNFSDWVRGLGLVHGIQSTGYNGVFLLRFDPMEPILPVLFCLYENSVKID